MKVISVLALDLLSALPTYAYYNNHLEARDAYQEARDTYLEAREAYMEELDGLQARDNYFETSDAARKFHPSQIEQPCVGSPQNPWWSPESRCMGGCKYTRIFATSADHDAPGPMLG